MPPGPERAAWRALLFAHSALVRILDEDLQRDCGVSLQWYDVMIRIWLAPDHTLRMSELAAAALLSRSWITRRVEQLEAAGLLRRHSAGGDGRGVCVTLTEEGRIVFARLEASHARSIRRHFSQHMTAQEAEVISSVLDRVADAAHETLAGAGGGAAVGAGRPARAPKGSV